MLGFKGFSNELKCRDMQYEVGKTFEEDKAILCNRGLHFCENPLDVLAYYSPDNSRYCTVEADDVSNQKDDNDSKRVCKKLTIKAEIGLLGLMEAAVEYINSSVDNIKKEINSGYRSAAVNSGDSSAAVNSGDRSAAVNSGDSSAAVNSGYSSAAVNSGDSSAAVNSGYSSAAVNSGDSSAAVNSGDRSAAVNSGYRSAAVNSGYSSAAVNSGDSSAAVNSGYSSAAVNSGDRSAAEVSGEESVAVALGIDGKAKGALGCWLVLSEWCFINGEYHRVNVKCRKVDGKHIKPDKYYALINNNFVEV